MPKRSQSRLPRGEVFQSQTAAVVWAAVMELRPEDQADVWTRLQMRLAGADTNADSHDLRVAGAQLALREVADLLGRSPSVAEYRSLRQEHPERSWPPDGTIRRILGGSWNEALKSSSLNTVAGGDMLVASLGSASRRLPSRSSSTKYWVRSRPEQ